MYQNSTKFIASLSLALIVSSLVLPVVDSKALFNPGPGKFERFWFQESSEESSSEEVFENSIDPRGVSSEESVEDNDVRFFKSFEDQELIHQLELINLLIASQRRHNDLADINPQDKSNLITLGNHFLVQKTNQLTPAT